MQNPTARQTVRADIILLGIALIWGLAFAFQRQGADLLGPLSFNAARYGLGAISIGLLLSWKMGWRGLWSPDANMRAGCVLGVALMLGTTLQQSGLAYTTAGKAGFITGLYVVIVPLVGLLLGQRPGWLTAAGALVAVVGLYFLSVKRDFSMGYGDVLVLGSAFCWAAHVLLTGYFAQRLDVLRLAFFQFITTGVLSLMGMLFMESAALAHFYAAVVPLLYTGIVATALAFTLQITAQKHSPPSHAALIMSLETVFAAFGGWLLLSESLTPRDWFGAGLMLLGILLSQAELFRPATASARRPPT